MAQNTPPLSRFTVLPFTRVDNGAGQLGWWTFDNGAATDYSGNGRDGILSGASVPVVQPNVLGPGAALLFSGSNYVNITNSTSAFNLTSTITACAWVFGTAFGTNARQIIAKGYNGSVTPWQFMVDASAKANFAMFNGALHGVASIAAVPLNIWTHLAGVFTGGTWYIYINGALDNSQADTAPGSNANPVYIGAVDNNGGAPVQFWTGSLRDVRVYGRDLSAAEINSIYNVGPQVISEYELPVLQAAVATAVLFRRTLNQRTGSRPH